jgi:predicted secreted Zn-dependent protease
MGSLSRTNGQEGWATKPEGSDATGYSSTAALVNLQVTGETNLRTPEWTNENSASPDDQQKWDAALSQLKAHEEEHVDIDRADIKAIQTELKGVSATGTGKTPQQAKDDARDKLQTIVRGVLAQHAKDRDKQNGDLDNKTHHGDKPDKKKEEDESE